MAKKQYSLGRSRPYEIGHDWTEWRDMDFGSLSVQCYDTIKFRDKPKRTPDEIIQQLIRDVEAIRREGNDDMDLDHLAVTLKGEW